MPNTSLSSANPANPASPMHHHGGGTIQDGSFRPAQEAPVGGPLTLLLVVGMVAAMLVMAFRKNEP